MAQWKAHQATSSSSAGMLSQFGIPPNVTIATFTHQNAPVKKTMPASSPAPKARQGESRRMARSIGTRHTKASGSRMPEAKSSRRGPTGKAMGNAAAPSRPVSTRAPSRQGTRTPLAAGGHGGEAPGGCWRGWEGDGGHRPVVLLAEPAGTRVSVPHRGVVRSLRHHAGPPEQPALQLGHPPGLPAAVVVVPEQVQEPVGQIEVQLLGERAPMGAGLPPRGLERHDDVAEVAGTRRPGDRRSGRKAQDVGGAVLARASSC